MDAVIKGWILGRRTEITKEMALRRLIAIQPSQERSVDYPGNTEQEVIEYLKEQVKKTKSNTVKEKDKKEIDTLETEAEVSRPASGKRLGK